MNFKEILAPVDEYRDHLREEHRKNTQEAFEELVQRSGVDEAANIRQVGIIRKLQDEVSKLSGKINGLNLLRIILILLAAAGSIGVVWYLLECLEVVDSKAVTPLWALISALTAIIGWTLIFSWLNGVIKKLNNSLAGKEAELNEALAIAWEQMRPLNELFQWDTVARVIMRTMPILQLDSFFSQARMDQLVKHFKLTGIDSVDQSVLCCQSGALNGNPLLLAETLNQYWTVKTYTGSKIITWREYDSSQKKTVTRTETLFASVTKPFPDYTSEKFIIYGNEAAPDLSFSREPNSISDQNGLFDKLGLHGNIKKLESMSRDLDSNFTIMDNREFDACFYAIDRDNEQQFRLLFTPLARQEMLKLLQDQKVGYGDDFAFRKKKMINIIQPSHLSGTDISASPEIFKDYELAAIRRKFNDYSNDFFRAFFFGIAPLLSIPLYQQHRNTLDIYKDVYSCGVSDYEYESLVNDWDESEFAPRNADTRSILKTRLQSRDQDKSTITVTAHAFAGHSRVEFVSTLGGDRRWHNVPVEWIEYLPVSRNRNVSVRAVPGNDGAEAQNTIFTQEWQNYFNACGVDYSNIRFRRNLVSFLSR